MADVRITEYTDPGCPWAYSAEPFRRRLNWLYGDRLEWRTVMVGLSDSPEHYTASGFTPERQAAARDAGIDPADLERWTAEPEVEAALDADMAAAREPLSAARVLDHKLANWSGGRRYTCPSYEIVRVSDGVRISVPGFQPFAVYDVVTANLLPGLDRRAAPESVEEVLAWTGTPLATKEVAVVCDLPFTDARERLGRVAEEQHVGFDGFWTLPGCPPSVVLHAHGRP